MRVGYTPRELVSSGVHHISAEPSNPCISDPGAHLPGFSTASWASGNECNPVTTGLERIKSARIFATTKAPPVQCGQPIGVTLRLVSRYVREYYCITGQGYRR